MSGARDGPRGPGHSFPGAGRHTCLSGCNLFEPGTKIIRLLDHLMCKYNLDYLMCKYNLEAPSKYFGFLPEMLEFLPDIFWISS